MNGVGRVEWMEPNLGPIFSVPKEMKNTEFILGHFKNWHRLLGSRLRTLSKIRDSIIESKGGLGGLHIYLFYLYLYLFYIYICVCVYIYIYIFFFSFESRNFGSTLFSPGPKRKADGELEFNKNLLSK